jgi:hypothetical protein
VPTGRLGIGSGAADPAGTLAAVGTELAGGVGPRGVAAGFGALLEVLFAGLHAMTVQERVPSRNVLRLTSNPIPRVLVLDRQLRYQPHSG